MIPDETAGTSQKPFVDRTTVLPERLGVLGIRSMISAHPATPSKVLFVMVMRPVMCAAPSLPSERFRKRLSASLKVAAYSLTSPPRTLAYQPSFHFNNEADESE